MRTLPGLRALALRMMLASMLAIVGHGAAMAAGIDRCAPQLVHGHALAATADAASTGAGHGEGHHGVDLRSACCVGACALAMIAPQPADRPSREPGAEPIAILAPQGLDPHGIERPPRA